MNEEEIEQENKLYESTKDFGRIQFIREIIKLQQENAQLKQQLKDKDEKISKAIEYINKCYFDDVKIDLTGSSDLEYEQDYFKDRILEILESNKED